MLVIVRASRGFVAVMAMAAIHWGKIVRRDPIDYHHRSPRLDTLDQSRDHSLRIVNVVQSHAHDRQIKPMEFRVSKRPARRCEQVPPHGPHLHLRHAHFAGFGVELVYHAFRYVNSSNFGAIRKQRLCLSEAMSISPFSRSGALQMAKGKGKKEKGKGVFNSHFRHEPRSAGVVE